MYDRKIRWDNIDTDWSGGMKLNQLNVYNVWQKDQMELITVTLSHYQALIKNKKIYTFEKKKHTDPNGFWTQALRITNQIINCRDRVAVICPDV